MVYDRARTFAKIAKRRENAQSQILPTTRPRSGRHADSHPAGARTRRPRFDRVDPALRQTDGGQHPVSAAALHALPRVLAHVGLAFGALQTAVELALL